MTTVNEVRTRRPFLRHYLEMVAAMFAGMLVIGGLVRGALALAGTALPSSSEAMAWEMAAEMAAAMVIWMRFRGHGWSSTLEMAGVMVAPAVALAPLVWLDVLSGDAFLLLEHVGMLLLMYAVMARRAGSERTAK